MDRTSTDEVTFEFDGVDAKNVTQLEIVLHFSNEAKEKIQTKAGQ